MATERLLMRHIREILRLKWVVQLSHREVAHSLKVSAGAVGTTVSRAEAAGLSWDEVVKLDDEALEQRLYGPRLGCTAQRPQPDWAYIHTERRRPGVTLELLHLEYLEQHPDGYRYTAFCDHYRQWLNRRRLSMRQEHRAGEKTFVDYSGNKPHFIDKQTGQRVEVELFVAVLGASSYTYAEATATQRGPDFIQSHVHAFAYFGGVTSIIVPDQLRSGVTTPCRYEPGIQRTYEEMATHYGTAVVPARPAHPRDKAKVEVAVLVAQRWILARLRNQTFFSLDELNDRIAELLEELNDRQMRIYKASRRELFLRLDRPALKPLPPQRFIYGEWKRARVNIDYHIEVEGHYYSVPHALVHEEVWARITSTTIEIFHHGQRIASHLRSFQRGQHTTETEHMPKAHQKHLEWTPSRLTHWAGTIGDHTRKLVEAILSERVHPEQGYRSCLGILRLGKRYGHERLEAACARALSAGARSYRHIESILKHGLDQVKEEKPTTQKTPIEHENIRGRDYYS
jgi:transposase